MFDGLTTSGEQECQFERQLRFPLVSIQIPTQGKWSAYMHGRQFVFLLLPFFAYRLRFTSRSTPRFLLTTRTRLRNRFFLPALDASTPLPQSVNRTFRQVEPVRIKL